MRPRGAAALLCLAGFVAACGGGGTGSAGTASPAPTTAVPIDGSAAVLVGAGDIAQCNDGGRAALTGHLAATVVPETATVFTLGDNAYPSGTTDNFAHCYDPAWGALRLRTRPAAGNHEWKTSGAAGYRAYFGDAAGPPDATWYAYDAGTWRVIVLDSECGMVGGCGPSSPQGEWLAAELAGHPAACSLAIWHRPRFSSGIRHGSDRDMAPLFEAVAAGGVDLVLNGHEHSYERFGRLAPDGSPATGGVREIVVGTGGADAYEFGPPLAGSEVRLTGVPAVLVLELAAGAYRWRLVGGDDARTLDEGSDWCRP